MYITKRIEWIDIAKGFSIILVVLGHTGLSGEIAELLRAFRMPFFFVASGLLFKSSKYPTVYSFIKKRSVNLIRPYIIFSTVVLLAIKLLNIDAYSKISYDVLYKGWLGAYPLWFIPVLFGAEVLFYEISRYLKSRFLVFVGLCLCSISGYLCYLNNIHLWYKIEVILTATFFYGFGNIFKTTIIDFIAKCSKYKLHIIGLIVLLLISLCFMFNKLNGRSLDLAFNILGNYIPAYLAAFSGIMMMFIISNTITRFQAPVILSFRSLISYIGKNSFVILAFHTLVLNGLKMPLAGIDMPYILNSIIRHMLMWGTLFLLIYVINNYAPWILGRKKQS